MTDTTDTQETTDYVLLSDPSTGTIARASSILQKNSKLYGPQHVLDVTNGSSCWNSNACPDGQSQFLLLEFGRPVLPQMVKLEFQAGFIAETCTVQLQTENKEWIKLQEMELDDTHDYQTYSLDNHDGMTCARQGTALKFVLNDFTDFYGRVTIYRMQVWGQEVRQQTSVESELSESS